MMDSLARAREGTLIVDQRFDEAKGLKTGTFLIVIAIECVRGNLRATSDPNIGQGVEDAPTIRSN